jgi:diaminopimelate decarboxylase
MERVANLVEQLRDDGHEINYVDAGGGLGIPYDSGGEADKGERTNGHGAETESGQAGPPSTELFFEYVSRYAQALLTPLHGLNLHLLLEPGRSIVGPAGALITAVLYRKTNNSKKFLIVDAGMNDLLRPSLYNAFHEVVSVELHRKDAGTEVVDIVGPVCETGDFFARDRKLPVVDEGDWLAILDTGAYGIAPLQHPASAGRSAGRGEIGEDYPAAGKDEGSAAGGVVAQSQVQWCLSSAISAAVLGVLCVLKFFKS